LEFLQSVIPAIRASGVPLQWSADITEHAHITLVKDPAENSNNQNLEPQICRHLDRREKCRQFDLATAIATAGVDFGARDPSDEESDSEGEDEPSLLLNKTSSLLDHIDPVMRLTGTQHLVPNYFRTSSLLLAGQFPNAPTPFRTFTSLDANIAFHLNRDPEGRQLSVDDAAIKFQLQDLRPALAAYLHRRTSTSLAIGGKRPKLIHNTLPFDKIQLWNKLRIQSRSFHDSDKILVPETVNAAPPDAHWKRGRGDAVLVNFDAQHQWPSSGLEGMLMLDATIYCLLFILKATMSANCA
jgi:hypothetical protein